MQLSITALCDNELEKIKACERFRNRTQGNALKKAQLTLTAD
jgi:hypothetical protein